MLNEETYFRNSFESGNSLIQRSRFSDVSVLLQEFSLWFMSQILAYKCEWKDALSRAWISNFYYDQVPHINRNFTKWVFFFSNGFYTSYLQESYSRACHYINYTIIWRALRLYHDHSNPDEKAKFSKYVFVSNILNLKKKREGGGGKFC